VGNPCIYTQRVNHGKGTLLKAESDWNSAETTTNSEYERQNLFPRKPSQKLHIFYILLHFVNGRAYFWQVNVCFNKHQLQSSKLKEMYRGICIFNHNVPTIRIDKVTAYVLYLSIQLYAYTFRFSKASFVDYMRSFFGHVPNRQVAKIDHPTNKTTNYTKDTTHLSLKHN